MRVHRRGPPRPPPVVNERSLRRRVLRGRRHDDFLGMRVTPHDYQPRCGKGREAPDSAIDAGVTRGPHRSGAFPDRSAPLAPWSLFSARDLRSSNAGSPSKRSGKSGLPPRISFRIRSDIARITPYCNITVIRPLNAANGPTHVRIAAMHRMSDYH